MFYYQTFFVSYITHNVPYPAYHGYRRNANMADQSVIARDEFHESEASEASVFCFDNACPSLASWMV